MRKFISGLFIILFISRAYPSFAEDHKLKLHAIFCRDIDGKSNHLVSDDYLFWMKFPHGVQVCPLYGWDGKLAWTLLTLRYDLMEDDVDNEADIYKIDPKTGASVPFPFPKILDPSGKQVGELSEAFPSSVPGRTYVTASVWHNNLPYRIDIHLVDTPPRGTYDAPSLFWNENTHRYETRER